MTTAGIHDTLFNSNEPAPRRPTLTETKPDEDLVRRVASIHSNSTVVSAASRRGLAVTVVQWEDTDRFKDYKGDNSSCWGNNISDFTLLLSKHNTRLPVIRYPNYQDKTVFIPHERFTVAINGEAAGMDATTLTRIPLLDYLKTHVKDSTGSVVDLSAPCDETTGILTSPQQCIVPLVDGTQDLNPHVFNYQTRDSSDPALLVLLSIQLGTSPQTVGNRSAELYFNLNGQAANLVAKRLRDDRAARGVALDGAMDKDELERNLMILYSVPLKQRARETSFQSISFQSYGDGGGMQFQGGGTQFYNQTPYVLTGMLSETTQVGGNISMPCCAVSAVPLQFEEDDGEVQIDSLDSLEEKSQSLAPPSSTKQERARKPTRGIDHAVLSVGEPLFKFPNGPERVKLVRDTSKPVRATVQFWSATDTEEVSDEVLDELVKKFTALYARGTPIGTQ